MANNCLVTKLKGSVQNDSLPILGKVVFNMETTANHGFFSLKGGTSSVTISLTNATVGGISTGQSQFVGATEFTIAAGEWCAGWFDLTQDNPKITIDSYPLGGVNISQYVLSIVGLDSASFGDALALKIPDTCIDEALPLNNMNGLDCNGALCTIEDRTEFVKRNASTLVRMVPYINYYEGFENNSVIEYCYPEMNCSQLPVSLKGMNASRLRGSLTDYVGMLRTAGRTSGKILVAYIHNNINVTILDNGEEIAANVYCANHNITSGNAVFLEWDASSLSLTTDSTGVVAGFRDVSEAVDIVRFR